MTNQRRRDKESCAGCHRKRTRPRVTRSTQGKVTLARLRVEWQSSPASAQFTFGALAFYPRDQFTAMQPFDRWRLTGTRSLFHETKI
jgi:hypothetical protein